jgi:hypothetical protein
MTQFTYPQFAPTIPPGPDDVLWMLDIGEDDWPHIAHAIVADDGVRRTTACGRVVTAATHPRGWWSFPRGVAPMASHAVHCGPGDRRDG